MAVSTQVELLTEDPTAVAARTIADHLAHHDNALAPPPLVLVDTEANGAQTPYLDVAAAGEIAARALRPFATFADGTLLYVLVDPELEPVIVRPDPAVGAPVLDATEDPRAAVMIDWIHLALAAVYPGRPKSAENVLRPYLHRGGVARLSQLDLDSLQVVVNGVINVLNAHPTVEFTVPTP